MRFKSTSFSAKTWTKPKKQVSLNCGDASKTPTKEMRKGSSIAHMRDMLVQVLLVAAEAECKEKWIKEMCLLFCTLPKQNSPQSSPSPREQLCNGSTLKRFWGNVTQPKPTCTPTIKYLKRLTGPEGQRTLESKCPKVCVRHCNMQHALILYCTTTENHYKQDTEAVLIFKLLSWINNWC